MEIITVIVHSVPLGEKRRKGRPKKIPHSLQKSPARTPIDVALEDVLEDILENENGGAVAEDYINPEPRKLPGKERGHQ
jgi:hypothetical protein